MAKHDLKLVYNDLNDDIVEKTKKLIIETVRSYEKSRAFAARKITDTPTDAFSLVNRRYVDRRERAIQAIVTDFTTDLATGDGQFYCHIDGRLGGADLTDVHARVITAGTTGTTDIQIRNVTKAVDMLSTKLTIDSGETGSNTAAVAAVINTSNDNVSENDLIAIDIDAVSTTAPKGLIVTLGFTPPSL